MKRIILLAIGLAIAFATNGLATPFLDNSATTIALDINGSSYSIADRSRIGVDIWDATYGGYSGADYTGYYLGTLTGDNDSETDLTNLIGYYLNDLCSLELEEIDAPDDSAASFEVTYDTDPNNSYSGTWSTSGDTAVEFYTIKGGTEYALYFVSPALQEGIWTTAHLLNGGDQIPAISHISAALTTSAPVPEPATMLLFGTGLAGFTGSRIRCKQKACEV